MEPAPHISVVSAPKRAERDTRKRRAPESAMLRVRLCNALAPVMSRMSTEAIRVALGDADASHTRREIGWVKARNVVELGWERLIWMCSRLGVDVASALAPPANLRVLQ